MPPFAQVHYGPASLSALSRLPTYFVFRQAPLDVQACAQQIVHHAAQQSGSKASLVLLDQSFAHAAARLRQYIDKGSQSSAAAAPAPESPAQAASKPAPPIIVADLRAGPLEPAGMATAARREPAGATRQGSCGCQPGVIARISQ